MSINYALTSQLVWQKPNATEYTSAQMLSSQFYNGSSNYLPFPWATWIDSFRKNGKTYPSPKALQNGGIRATVCQHIWAIEHLDIFKNAGITDIFWSHTTQTQREIDGIRLHPFPLYPVRCKTHPPAKPLKTPSKRSLLFCFQGNYNQTLYLSPVREWIMSLPKRNDILLEQRREWHFDQAVYREQILGGSADPQHQKMLNSEADEYSATIQNSCFSLCPSGSGPNSIRLWESLGYGSIPVILSDQLQLPGPNEMWESAAVVIPETPEAISALPAKLEQLSMDQSHLLAMQIAGQKIWKRYGLDGFIGDLTDFLDNPMNVLRARAHHYFYDEPVEIEANFPTLFPLELRHCLQRISPNRSVLIVITDQAELDLLEIRWKTALQICADRMGKRAWAVASISPILEKYRSKTIKPIRNSS